jgi:motility quorum-sensing regulator/GCU-specific mRNA interferase toxin
MLPYNERTPTYDLQQVQWLVGQGPLSRVITSAARVGARDCGFVDTRDIVSVVLALSPKNFYKTMEAERCPGLWQDVYHSSFHGVNLYIKLQISFEGAAVIVQFKER